MKIFELVEGKKPDGTYAGVKFSQDTIDAIEQYCTDNKIPRAVSGNKLHCTLLYSRKYLPKFEPVGEYKEPLIGKPSDFEIWQSQSTDENPNPTRCLVLKFKCPDLESRHKELMHKYDATYDFPKYKTHVTLSYNVDDLDIKDLPKFTSPIIIISEYSEDLNLSWADKNADRNKKK